MDTKRINTAELMRENEKLRRQIAEHNDFPNYPNLIIYKRLADSGQAVVYQGEYNKNPVAVKVFKAKCASDYRQELDNVLRLGNFHCNIISIITCFDTPFPCVVMPFYPKGDLQHYLERVGAPDVHVVQKIAVGITQGIKYLHDKKLIHRDLKSPNILLTEHDVPVIADFGLAKISTKALTTVSGCKGTYQWMAPEMMESKKMEGGNKYSNKVDIYAFGIILWELLSGQVPYAREFTEITELIANVTKGNRPPINHSWDRRLVQLIKKCWDQNPNCRPTITEVLISLTGKNPLTEHTERGWREREKRENELREREKREREQREREERDRKREREKREKEQREREEREREKREKEQRECEERDRVREYNELLHRIATSSSLAGRLHSDRYLSNTENCGPTYSPHIVYPSLSTTHVNCNALGYCGAYFGKHGAYHDGFCGPTNGPRCPKCTDIVNQLICWWL